MVVNPTSFGMICKDPAEEETGTPRLTSNRFGCEGSAVVTYPRQLLSRRKMIEYQLQPRHCGKVAVPRKAIFCLESDCISAYGMQKAYPSFRTAY